MLKIKPIRFFISHRTFASQPFTGAKTCFYRILNVSAAAELDEIKNSFYKLAKKYHPDSNPESQVIESLK